MKVYILALFYVVFVVFGLYFIFYSVSFVSMGATLLDTGYQCVALINIAGHDVQCTVHHRLANVQNSEAHLRQADRH